MISKNPIIEIIPRRLFWFSDKVPPANSKNHIFSTDDTYQYISYHTDFGPLDISQIVQYCRTLKNLLENPKCQRYPIYHYTSVVPAKRANSALLICSYQVLVLKKAPEEIWEPFAAVPRFLPYRDASNEQNKFELHILDCLKALSRAQSLNWLDVETFDIEEYNKNADSKNGGFNWIVPEKLISFPCPNSRSGATLSVEEYCRLFECCGVSAVVRVYQSTYDSVRFKKLGIRHFDIEETIDPIPSEEMIKQFIEICRRENVIAVHCANGLGVSVTLIGCYAIKHYSLTGKEFIAWARMCRPRCVLGQQQYFLCGFYDKLCEISRKGRQKSDYDLYEVVNSPDFTRKSMTVKSGFNSVKAMRQPVTYKTRYNQLVRIDPELMKLYGKKG